MPERTRPGAGHPRRPRAGGRRDRRPPRRVRLPVRPRQRGAAADAPLRGARPAGLVRAALLRERERAPGAGAPRAACRCSACGRSTRRAGSSRSSTCSTALLAGLLLVLLAPLLAGLALATRLSSPGPGAVPPAPHRPRRPRVRDAQVPLDAPGARADAERPPPAQGGRRCRPTSAPGGVEGDDRRTWVGHADAPHLARRAAPAVQRAARRHEPGGPAPRAARVRRALRLAHRPLRRPPPGQVRHHRAGPRCTGCAARPRCATGSSGTTTTSRTGRSALDFKILLMTVAAILQRAE